MGVIRFSNLAGGSRCNSQPGVCKWHCYTGDIFPQPTGRLLTYMSYLELGWRLETLYKSLKIFLCVALSFPALCPVNSNHIGLSRLSVPSQLRESTVLCLGSPSMHYIQPQASQGRKLLQSQGSPHLLPISQRSLSSIAWSQRLAHGHFICFAYFWSF